jgi:hypothetical protein
MGLVSFMSQIDLAQKLIMETKLKTNGKWGGLGWNMLWTKVEIEVEPGSKS